MSRNHLAPSVLGSLLILTASCRSVPAGAPKTLVFSTDHFEYYDDGGDPCPTLGLQMEEHYAANSAWLGANLPSGQRIRYFHLSQDDSLTKLCDNGDAVGCADGTDVFAFAPLQTHELIHAYSSLVGDPPLFFQEGLAVLLGDESGDDGRLVDRSADVEEMMATDDLLAGDYLRVYEPSASLTREIIAEGDARSYRDFYASTPSDADGAQIADVFARALGSSLTTVLSDWHAGVPEPRGDDYWHLAQCRREPLAIDETEQTVGPLACDQVDLSDGVHPGWTESREHVSWPDGGWGIVRLQASSDVTASMNGCDHYLAGWNTVSGGSTPGEFWGELPSGDYRFDVIAVDAPAEPDVTVSLGRFPNALAGTCADADPQVLDTPLSEWRIASPSRGSRNALFARVSVSNRQTLELRSNPFATEYDLDSLEVCTGECTALTCVDGTAGSFDLAPGVTYTLRMGVGSGSGPFAVTLVAP